MLTRREIVKGRAKTLHSVLLGLTIIAGLCFYFLPTIIAINRGANCRATIFSLRSIFGWTIVGWLATVIWAAKQHARDGELARSSPVDRDTWTFDRSKVSDPSAEQSDDWVLA